MQIKNNPHQSKCCTHLGHTYNPPPGGQHGQEVMPQDMVNNIHRAGLHALQRSTLYKTVKDFGPAATAQPELADPALLIAAGG